MLELRHITSVHTPPHIMWPREKAITGEEKRNLYKELTYDICTAIGRTCWSSSDAVSSNVMVVDVGVCRLLNVPATY